MEPTQYRGGRIKKGWTLTKSSWEVLKLDKELMTLPVLSAVASLLAVVLLVGIIVGGLTIGSVQVRSGTYESSFPWWANALVGIVGYFVLTMITNFFSGAIIFGAIERFRGEDPTVRGSLRAAMKKFRPLALFSLLMATVGLALQTLEERVPFAGKIAVWLLNSAWSIANVFAVPVIVMSDKTVQPFEATKESVRIIRKVWGEGVVAQFGVSIIATLSILAYAVSWTILGAGVYAVTHASLLLIIGGVIAVFGLLALVVVFTTLSSIVKAALYHYAVTGIAPEHFNQELLRVAMTPKKARKIFA